MGLRAAPGIEGVLHARAPAERPTSRRSRGRDPRRVRRLGPRRPRADNPRPARPRDAAAPAPQRSRRHAPPPRSAPPRPAARSRPPPTRARSRCRATASSSGSSTPAPTASRSSAPTTNTVAADDQGRRRAAERRARPGQPLRVRRQRRAATRSRVIRITNPTPERSARGRHALRPSGRITTGAEPWNIVISPDGRRVFVANSGQDTITVHRRARPRRLIGHVDLRSSRCNGAGPRPPLPAARPGGDRRTASGCYVTRFLSFTRPGGKQGDDDGREGVVCRLDINTESDRASPTTGRRSAIALAPAGHRLHDRLATATASPDPTSAFPNQLQSIVIRGNQAYLPNIAASPDGPLRFNLDTQAFVNVDRRRQQRRSERRRARAQVPQPAPRRARPGAGQEEALLRQPLGDRLHEPAGPAPATSSRPAATCWSSSTSTADGQAQLHGRRRHDPLHRPQRPGQPGDHRRNAGKNPQGIVINTAGHARLRGELRLAQRLGRRT